MSEKKQLFLVGAVLGLFTGLAVFALFYVFYTYHENIFLAPLNKINYQVNLESVVSEAVKKASPDVVGIVKYKDGKETSTGSGVIYKLTTDKAYIITNHHVIDGNTSVEVAFSDDNRVEAKVLGDDVITDLAVLSIPRGELNSYMEFSDSNSLQVGDFVLAIGNPLGLKFYGSATIGIVSSTERLIPVDIDKDGENDWFADVIQTDAAINPGNSGGALVNVDGKLVGINSMKIAGASVEGLGFSIPSNIVCSVVNDLERYGTVRRPYIGIQPVSISNMSDQDKSKINLSYLKSGIYVNDVVPASTAANAGIKVNDVIVKVDHEDIKDVTDFRLKIYKHKIGDLVTLSIIRDNKEKDVQLMLQAKG